MNDHCEAWPQTVPNLIHETWAAPSGAVHLSARGSELHPRDGGWYGWVPVSALAHLADGPAAERALPSKRLFLQDTAENQRLAELLRDRPEDFGRAGEPIVLWAAHLAALRRPGDRITLQLHKAHCVNGYQSLVTIARVMREVAPGHLDRACARVEIYGGGPEELSRLQRLFHDSPLYANALLPQDDLVRCPDLARIADEYAKDRVVFDPRRGIISGPHTRSHDIGDVFRALACFHPAPTPAPAHMVSTGPGLDATWSDRGGAAYRELMNEDVRALGVQRAVEAYVVARQVVDDLARGVVREHALLMRHAPDLIVWTAARALPLEQLHSDGAYVFAGWSAEHRRSFSQAVGTQAEILVSAYRELYPKPDTGRKRYQGEVDRLDVWLTLVDRLRRVGVLRT